MLRGCLARLFVGPGRQCDLCQVTTVAPTHSRRSCSSLLSLVEARGDSELALDPLLLLDPVLQIADSGYEYKYGSAQGAARRVSKTARKGHGGEGGLWAGVVAAPRLAALGLPALAFTLLPLVEGKVLLAAAAAGGAPAASCAPAPAPTLRERAGTI